MLGATSPLHPFPPFRAAWAKTHYPPSTEQTLSPGKLPSRIDLGENLILASKSESKVMVQAQDDRLEQIQPNGITRRGQIAELVTSAG